MPLLKVKTVVEADKEARRQNLVIIVLSTICLFGFSYVIYDYIQIGQRVAMPRELSEVDVVMQQLQADGLVSSLDVPEAKLTVNEQEWSGLSRGEKIAIVTQLARYCASKNQRSTWSLTVFGTNTTAKLGELGLNGFIIN